MSTRETLPLFAVYGWPLLVGVFTAAGLAAALTGEGTPRVFSWFALSFPVAVIAVCLSPILFRRIENRQDERMRN